MRCPFCKEDKDKVIDSRSSSGGRIIRRRRLCLECRRRFTTYERIEESIKLTVVKKDGTRVPYDRAKIVAGVQKSCYKRPVAMQQIEALAEEVEEEVFRRQGQEVNSSFIGDQTMIRLKTLDEVAYVRYASVYHEFKELDQFITEVQEVKNRPEETQGQKHLFDQ